MKFPLAPIAVSIVCVAQPVQADVSSDTAQIFELIAQLFSSEFTAGQPVLTFDTVWLYQVGTSGVIVGVNQATGEVYLLGGAIGPEPVLVGQSDAVVALLQGQASSTDSTGGIEEVCNTSSSVASGYSYSREGNVITVSTNGQCIEIPENQNYCEATPEIDAAGAPVATGLHVLTQTNVESFNFSGLEYNIPGMDSPLDSMAQGFANSGSCIINAPADFTNMTINTDICFDMTSQLSGLSSIPGVLTITPPVTTSFMGTSVITTVSDCFATGALSITDIVTEQSWILTNGSYVQIN
ncbi:MAG: hypothetical protein methR_P2724 [Methyloprofundus sp.]|nr:MAG: hypothetical protein methR_P2724 [Methyloprofundus sp.]